MIGISSYHEASAPLKRLLITTPEHGESKRGFASLINQLPLSFEGEGDTGGEVDKQSLIYSPLGWL